MDETDGLIRLVKEFGLFSLTCASKTKIVWTMKRELSEEKTKIKIHPQLFLNTPTQYETVGF